MEFPNGEGACAGASAGALREFGEGEIDWTGVEDRKVISIIPELGPFYTVTFDLFLNSIQDVRESNHVNRLYKARTKGNILDFKESASRVAMGLRWSTGKAPFKKNYLEESDECKFGTHSHTKVKLTETRETRNFDKNRDCIPSGKVPITALRSFLTFELGLPWNAESPELSVWTATRVSQDNFRNKKTRKTLEVKKWHKIELTRHQLGKSDWQLANRRYPQVGMLRCYVSLKVDGNEIWSHKIQCTGGTEERYKNVTIMSGNHEPTNGLHHEPSTQSFIPDMKMKNLKITNLPDIWPKKG